MIGGNYARHDTSVRVALDPDALQRFTINQREDPPPRPLYGEPAPRSRRKIEYNVIGDFDSCSSSFPLLIMLSTDLELFREIQAMESFGDFGSKVQTLIRHLLYLQNTEPDAKSIVFSAWADSLYSMLRNLHVNLTDERVIVVQYALQENGKLWCVGLLTRARLIALSGINCLRIDQRSKGQSAANKFKSDPTISVLLLHG